MNLGNFAGGLAQGYDQQQRLQLAQQEQASNQQFRERSMQMQEQDQAAKQAALKRQQQMQKEGTDIYNDLYGPKQTVTGYTEQDDGNGGTTKVPTVTTTQEKPGENPETTAKYAYAHAALVAKYHEMTPEIMAQTAQMVDQGRRTAAGKELDKVMQGDASAVSALVTKMGKDPEGAKLQYDPAKGVNQVVDAKGNMLVDLNRAYAASATAEKYKQIMAEQDSAQKTQHNLAQTKYLSAEGDKNSAEAKEIPANAAAERGLKAGQTYHAYQAGNLSGANKSALLDEKRQRDLDARINTTIGKTPDATGDGKTEWMAPKQWVQSKVTGALSDNPKADMNGVFNDALTRYSQIKSATQKQLTDAVSNPDKLKALQARYGVKDKATILQRMTEENLERN